MPCLEISMPRMGAELKANLARELTLAFGEVTPFPSDIFGIRFYEYEEGEAYSGGKKCPNGEDRPYLHFLLYIPKINRETKSALVNKLSQIFVELTGKPAWLPVIHISEHPYDNVGVEGKTLSELIPELADRKFYYDL